MKLLKLPLLAYFFCWIGSQTGFACKYNVRDVGFVDLETEPYGLICYVDDSCEDGIAETFDKVASEKLARTNVRPLVINVDKCPDEFLLTFMGDPEAELPVFVLVSAAMETMKVESIETDADFQTSLGEVIEEIVSSPGRRQIAEKVIETFGVVLVLKGTDSSANDKARVAAQAAIKQIKNEMEWLPKPAGKPPVMMTMSREQQQAEDVFLWSMGVDPNDVTQPQAMVLYGRGRLMWQVLHGEDLTEKTLASLLYVIGADCECGLDRSWMQGNMMPFRWSDDLLRRIGNELRFDTEHPMIKFEIDKILRRGTRFHREKINLNMIGDYDLGYTKITEVEGVSTMVSREEIQSSGVTFSEKAQDRMSDEELSENEDEFTLWNPFYMIGGGGVAVAVAGVCLAGLKSRKRQ